MKIISLILFVVFSIFSYNGNIDLNKRPIVYNENGSYSTVLSFSVNIDNMEIILPTIDEQGNILTIDQAIYLYKETGKYLGKYKTVKEAIREAKRIHKEQEKIYNKKVK
jgi:hypothetical protein